MLFEDVDRKPYKFTWKIANVAKTHIFKLCLTLPEPYFVMGIGNVQGNNEFRRQRSIGCANMMLSVPRAL